MGLNIQNPELEADIRELAEREGLGLTEILRSMVDERLERTRRVDADREARIAEILEIGARFRRSIAEAGEHVPTLKELDDVIYDEDGLPK